MSWNFYKHSKFYVDIRIRLVRIGRLAIDLPVLVAVNQDWLTVGEIIAVDIGFVEVHGPHLPADMWITLIKPG